MKNFAIRTLAVKSQKSLVWVLVCVPSRHHPFDDLVRKAGML
ncbi:hypothetical protein BUH_0700 [Burkholderia pseudomallei Pakistan 9]|nr:hypothetical protein BUH_0700 [Burkholderia pseudomallei Pakistan 9]